VIKELKLRNWKSHKSSDFTFSNGVNALLGIMGSGKSSVMDAISYALFGTFPALRQRKVKLDDLIRTIPEQAATAKVELTFISNGKEYRVIREIARDKGTTNAEIREGNTLINGPDTKRVTESVEGLLKIDYDLFSRAIYSEQNQIDYFLNIPKGRRMESIDRLLRIDKYEAARKNATSLLNQLKDENATKTDLLKGALTEKDEETLSTLGKELEKIEAELGDSEKKIGGKEKALEEVKKVLAELEEKEKEVRELKSQKERLGGQINQIKERLATEKIEKKSLSEIQTEKKTQKSALESLIKQREAIESLEKEKASTESSIKTLTTEIKRLRDGLIRKGAPTLDFEKLKKLDPDAILETLEEKNASAYLTLLRIKYNSREWINNEKTKVEQERLDAEKEREALRVKKERSEKILSDLGEKDTCPLCETELKGAKKEELLSSHEEKIKSAESTQEMLSKKIEALMMKKAELDGAAVRVQAAEEAIGKEAARKEQAFSEVLSMAENLRKNEKNIEKLNSMLKDTQSKLEPCRKEYSKEKEEIARKKLGEIERQETALKEKDSLSKLEEELGTSAKKIKEIGFSEELLSKTRTQKEEITLEIEKKKSEEEAKKALLKEKSERLGELREKKKLFEEYKKDIEWIDKTKNLLEVFTTALKKTQQSLREEFIVLVNEAMSDIWPHLYPYGDISDVKLLIEEGDYVLKARAHHGWTNVEGIVSGGERTLACLTLRIAFSLALAPNLSWLVLDEPTHNLDAAAIEELASVMKTCLPDMINQIFLITHEERLESAVTGYLYKLERDKSADEPTNVALVSEPQNI